MNKTLSRNIAMLTISSVAFINPSFGMNEEEENLLPHAPSIQMHTPITINIESDVQESKYLKASEKMIVPFVSFALGSASGFFIKSMVDHYNKDEDIYPTVYFFGGSIITATAALLGAYYKRWYGK